MKSEEGTMASVVARVGPSTVYAPHPELLTRLGNLFAGIWSYGLIVNRIHRDLYHILRRGQ